MSHADRRTLAIDLFTTLALIIPYFIYLFASPYYVSGPDEAWQIQGIREMLAGHGYRSSLHAIFEDLSNQKYFYLHSWPVGFPAVVAFFTKFGLSLEFSLKFFHFTSMSLGLLAWMVMARKLLAETSARLLFLALLVPQLLAWGVYPTALASWALTPVLAWIALGYPQVRRPLGLGAVAAALVFFRYQNIIFIPAVAFYLAWMLRGNWRAAAREITLATLPPVFAFLGIFLANRMNAGIANPVDDPIGFYWNWFWIPDYLKAFFLSSSYRVDEILRNADLLLRSVSLLLGLAAAGLLLLLYRRAPLTRNSIVFFLCIFFSLAGLLLAMALLFNAGTLLNGRYHHFLFPYLLLLLVAAVAQWANGRARKLTYAMAAAALLGSLAANYNFTKHRRALAEEFAGKAGKLSAWMDQVRASDPEAPLYVLADQMFPYFAVHSPAGLAMENYNLLGSGAHFSKPTWFFVVADLNPMKAQFSSLTGLEELERKLALEKTRIDSLEVYWRKFPAGPLLASPNN